ncbi:triose-phosphate isomerase family protein [Cryobacterium sp. AP23]
MTFTTSAAGTFVFVSTKTYLGYAQSLAWLERVRALVGERPWVAQSNLQIAVFPTFPVIPAAVELFAASPISVGAQNVSIEAGPITGEVTAGLLAEIGAGYAEIGHAERRALAHESDEDIASKVQASVAAGLIPLLCVGEPTRQSTADAVTVVLGQIESAIALTGPDISLVLAYEPVWAIGASRPADAGFVNEVVSALHDRMPRPWPVLYGGSAGPGLLADLPAVSGLFLGRFAHDPDNFARVLDEARDRTAVST